MLDQVTFWASLAVVIGAVAAFLKWVWPYFTGFFKALNTTFETINGKPAVVDKAGRVVMPPEPSLRVQLADLNATVADQAAQNDRLTSLEVRVERLEDRTQLERLMARHESTSAFNAIEAIANQDTEDK